MVRPLIGSDRGEQVFLLPVDARDLLPAGQLVWDVQEMVEDLDLTAFAAAYHADGQGHPPYDPKMILTLVLYCFAKGFMSGRKIVGACHDDVGARVVTANRYPSRTTIDRFLDTHQLVLRALLPQTL